MQRDYKAFFEDIMEAISKIERYTKGLTLDEFKSNEIVIDANLRNLEIKNKLPDLKNKISAILEMEKENT